MAKLAKIEDSVGKVIWGVSTESGVYPFGTREFAEHMLYDGDLTMYWPLPEGIAKVTIEE